MLTFGELAAFIQRQARELRNELTLETHIVLAEVAKDAEALIGQERSQWDPLKESTVEEKQRLGYTGHVSATDPLLRTGEMRGSIESDCERTGSGVEGVVGTNSKIAVFHEMGTSKMPARPFLAPAMMQGEKKLEKRLGEFAFRLLIPGIR